MMLLLPGSAAGAGLHGRAHRTGDPMSTSLALSRARADNDPLNGAQRAGNRPRTTLLLDGFSLLAGQRARSP